MRSLLYFFAGFVQDGIRRVSMNSLSIKTGSFVKYAPDNDSLQKLNEKASGVSFYGAVTALFKIKGADYAAVDWNLSLDEQGNPVNVNADLPKTVKSEFLKPEIPDGVEVTLKSPVEILFAKTRENAVIPTKRREDAGFDFYACFDEDALVIAPGETKMISTGIATCCDADYFYMAKERGSTGTKGMAIRCGVIDSGYRNEWFICYTNTTAKPIVIAKESVKDSYSTDEYLVYPYEKAIAQGILLPNTDVVSREIPYSELKEIPSERGLGKIGSSLK